MTATSSKLQFLIDRQEILDCLTRYCRGVDRLDKELVLSAYHADAIDNHGIFSGNAAKFWEWVSHAHGTGQQRTMHTIMNHSCDIDGDVAHTETYCVYYGLNCDDSFDLTGCRYVDRFERRHGYWRIAHRTCVTEWFRSISPRDVGGLLSLEIMAKMTSIGPNCRDSNDVSYQRS